MKTKNYDALLFVSFGGPEAPEHVIPFLENVLRGKNVPQERLLEVAEHYKQFGGVSPINQQCRELIDALQQEFSMHNIDLPIYWGNRNWTPLLPDTIKELKQAGAKRVLTFITSGFSCYSGCRQYRENVYAAQDAADANDIEIEKIRVFYNHPDFVGVNAESVRAAMSLVGGDDPADVQIAFTAHSIPDSMASTSDYEKQLRECCRLVAEELQLPEDRWKLVYQSRSGRPQDVWLDPDICDHLEVLHYDGAKKVVISPIGFLSDHMEVLYDLDDEAQKKCSALGMTMARAKTPGTHPRFVSMIRKLVEERMGCSLPECLGEYGPGHDICPSDCCPAPRRPSVAKRPTTAG